VGIWRYYFLIVLLSPILFSISINAVFAEEHPLPEDSPIQIILDQSLDQAKTAGGGTGIDDSADRLYQLGLDEYAAAIALLEAGDTEGATEHALVAMALFEDVLVILGPAEGDEILVLDQLPTDIQNQLDANSIFSLVESITGSESDAEYLSSLISTNGFDIDLGDYNDALDNAKESLANGDLIGAEEQLDLANELHDDVHEEIYEAIDSEQPERIDAFIENTIETLEFIISNAQTLDLTDDDVASIQATLAILESGDVDKILEATSEDSELTQGQDYDPQISANEDGNGENRGNDVPPGFETKIAEDNLPPGFEMMVDGLEIDEDGNLVATGEGNLPPGFLNMLENEKQLPKGFLKKLAGIEGFESLFGFSIFDNYNDDLGIDVDFDGDYDFEVDTDRQHGAGSYEFCSAHPDHKLCLEEGTKKLSFCDRLPWHSKCDGEGKGGKPDDAGPPDDKGPPDGKGKP